jgi:invasion protein IalB
MTKKLQICAALVASALTLSSFTGTSVRAQEAEPEQPVAAPKKKPAAPKAAAKPGAKGDVKGTQQGIGSWTVVCGPEPKKQGGCSAQLQMVDPKSKSVLLTLLVGYSGKGVPLIEAITPTGVVIGPGVQLTAGKLKLRSPYVQCGPTGCSSRFAIDGNMQEALKTAKELKFAVVTISQKVIEISVKPEGNAKMLAKMGL